MNSINLNVMNILWAFKVSFAKDPVTGSQIPVESDANDMGIVLAPKEYRCSLTPRSQAKEDIIREQFTQAKEVFDLFEYGPDDICWT